MWRSASRGYVVEHTRIEAFEGQIQDDVAFQRLVGPLVTQFDGVVPGRFLALIPAGVASHSTISFDDAREEIAKLIGAHVSSLSDGEAAVLRSDQLPYEVRLRKRHSKESRVLFGRWIEGLPDDGRSVRIGRALDQKIPKLRSAAQAYELPSVLVLESNDMALSNVFEVGQAFTRAALEGRGEVPDLVFLVESEGVPFYGWLMKDGDVVLPAENYFEDNGTDDR